MHSVYRYAQRIPPHGTPKKIGMQVPHYISPIDEARSGGGGGGLSGFLQDVMDRALSVSTIKVDLTAQDTEALEEVAQAAARLDPNSTLRHHVGKTLGGEPLFSTNKPTTKNLVKEFYTLTQPNKHTHPCLKPHVPVIVPNYCLSPDTPCC